MSLDVADASLKKISKRLHDLRADRECVIKDSRDVISLCSQSIINVHAGKLAEAREDAAKAQMLLRKIKRKTLQSAHANLITAEQEIVEARALIAIADKKQVPTPKSMSVSDGAYVLGLLDCIGELKRRVLDKIRTGDSDEAVRVFDVMNGLYELLYPFAAYDKIVREARRKLDVNRELIERARFAVSESARMSRLEEILGSR